MTILYYSTNIPKDLVQDSVRQIKNITQDEVIAVPKEWSLLLDCSTDQLLALKESFNSAIDRALEQRRT